LADENLRMFRSSMYEIDPNQSPVLLSPAEARVLGCLLEKEITTPDYYPLTLNGLTNACNQKSNRAPVMLIEEVTVREAADGLRAKKMAMMFHGAEARVAKFKHTLENVYQLEAGERAVLCELLLRGPQTPGELRGRCERLHAFPDLASVETALQSLADFPGAALVSRLPRQPGKKEQRYAHLLSGPVTTEIELIPASTPIQILGADAERIKALEEITAELQREVEALKEAMAEFRRQFE
jgi:uncharacterized protein